MRRSLQHLPLTFLMALLLYVAVDMTSKYGHLLDR